MNGEWQYGLCGCFNNCGICIVTYFLPCLTAGQNAAATGKHTVNVDNVIVDFLKFEISIGS